MKTRRNFIQRDKSRRNFIKSSSFLVAGTGIATLSGMVASCGPNQSSQGEREGMKEGEEEMVSPNEDLMREHGLLQRMLIIYDTAMQHFSDLEDFDPALVNQTAYIIRNFIEDYHEKLEEEHVFPRLEKAGRLTDLTAILRNQHQAGRKVTERILFLTKDGKMPEGKELEELINRLRSFNIMYRPHEAREDTVLFPAFKEVVSENEYNSLGEDFEEIEHQKFGQDGFDLMVEKVSDLEKKAGTYDLNKFTPII